MGTNIRQARDVSDIEEKERTRFEISRSEAHEGWKFLWHVVEIGLVEEERSAHGLLEKKRSNQPREYGMPIRHSLPISDPHLHDLSSFPLRHLRKTSVPNLTHSSEINKVILVS